MTNDFDVSRIDRVAFAKAIDNLRAEAEAGIGEADFQHLKKIERWGRLSGLLGFCTAWVFPNPITAFLLHLGPFTRWLIAHHVLHRGYDKVPGIPARYTSLHFAKGNRRWIDWFELFEPAAWSYEHNQLHHYHTGENEDPDLVEEHLRFLQGVKIPRFLKYFFVLLAMCTWKFTFYAPNTASVLAADRKKRVKSKHIAWLTFRNIFSFGDPSVRSLWLRSYLPYIGFRFVFLPVLFLPFGAQYAVYALFNFLLAELITNFHSFFVIGPNHTADDLYRFHFHYDSKEEFYITQVLGSANYKTGPDLRDYLSLWLNYQIEHHLFPDLTMLKYQEVQPKVKALCELHGLPYRQESIFKRHKRMLDVCVGKTDMQEMQVFPNPVIETPGAVVGAS